MPPITSFSVLEEEIKKTRGRPTVLEVLWDGDTNGWYLFASLYVEKRMAFWKKEERVSLGVVTLKSDEMLFPTEAPLWPEAVLIKEWGRKASEKFGLTFYFPSENEPDDDCPSWHQRHLAIKCEDCHKLIIPTESPYLPNEICYPCHLLRERNEELKADALYDEGVTMFLSNGENDEHEGYCTLFKDFAIAPYIQSHVDAKMIDRVINVICIYPEEISGILSEIEGDLNVLIANYLKPIVDERLEKFHQLHSIEYNGVEYQLDSFKAEHLKLSKLFYCWESASKALSQSKHFMIYFKNGFSKREDAILRFVNYVCKGTADTSDVVKRFNGVITEAEVLKSIEKLEKNACLTTAENKLKVTRTGKNIV